MADLCRISSVEEDPLRAYSGLSLFNRTLKSSSVPALTPTLKQSEDLHHTNALLESLPFEIRKEHQEQEKSILDENLQMLKQGVETSVASDDMNVGSEMDPIPKKRERRPGVERKHGRFSFKPITSQPSQNEPVFDDSKYRNFEDYFAELARFKNSKREWDKQRGAVAVATDTHQNQPARRPRRPEVQRRERVTYKHTYTDASFTDLKALERENLIHTDKSLETTTAVHLTTVDKEVDDSPVNKDKKLENVLTELLACSPDKHERDHAVVKLMEERLNIKPIDIEMLSLHKLTEFPDVRQLDLKASVRNRSIPRTALSDIQNFPKGIYSDATQRNNQPSSSNPQEDQFPFPGSHFLLPGDRQSTEVDLSKDLNVCFRSSVAKDADNVVTNASPSNVGNVNVASTFNSSVQKSSCKDGSDTHTGIHRSQSNPDGNTDICVDDSITNINSAVPEVNVDMQIEGNDVDVPMSEYEANINTGRRGANADINEETEQLNNLVSFSLTLQNLLSIYMDLLFFKSLQEVNNSSHKQTSERRKRGSSYSHTKKRSKTNHNEIEEDKQMKTVSHESGGKKPTKRKPNEKEEKKKQVKRVTRESKIFSRRKSLADAGTNWEAGVRRSTRIKSRPLEYWRGEKFLFGRIHESLTTVIGVKYASPDNGRDNEKRVLKVKSFVSDDYKHLVDKAAIN
ncbi:unnamed protein product [Cochlearia groenlandica]